MAAGWPVDATNDDTLSWVTWDEYGKTLEQTIPLLPDYPAPPDPVPLHRLETPAVAAAIKDARLSKKLSRRALAEAAGVGHRMVAKYENAECKPGLATWDRLQELLGPLGDGRAA